MTLFGQYDQAALDAQYNNTGRVPHFKTYVDRWIADSAKAYAHPGWRRDIAYGESPAEVLDVFPAARPKAPVMVFFHGGYWRSRENKEFAFLLDGFRASGAALVLAEYGLCPAVTMTEIVRQCRKATAWVYRHAAEFGADPARLYVSGHSAGGHLVGEILATDWIAFEAGLPRDPVKGGVAISGLYDLEPIRLSFLNADLKMDKAEAKALSPMLHVPPRAPKLIVAVGGDESEEYHRQQTVMIEAWRAKRLAVEDVPMPGHNHFSIIGALADPASALNKAALALMGVA